ncbi:potassium channel family protein [Streptomyces phaeochromogenes]|nr:potassium channel family protein [Streptomyces phaeochromogenes]
MQRKPGTNLSFSSSLIVPDSIKLAQRRVRSPFEQVGRRLFCAALVLLTTVTIVYFGRDGYHDNADDTVDLLDSFYYATVTLSTTGYGDLVPQADSARLVNIMLITPLRIVFLIILVGTTLEALAERTHEDWRVSNWRSKLKSHTIIVGYGTKGRLALNTLGAAGLEKGSVIVIDSNSSATENANQDGYASIVGDATRREVLISAELNKAKRIIIATQRDDTAALVALSAKQINSSAKIIAAVREEENVSLLRQSGADSVVTSSSAAGRLLGLSSISPGAGTVIDEIIHCGTGLNIVERPALESEIGKSVDSIKNGIVLSILRKNLILSYDHPGVGPIEPSDRMVILTRESSKMEKIQDLLHEKIS